MSKKSFDISSWNSFENCPFCDKHKLSLRVSPTINGQYKGWWVHIYCENCKTPSKGVKFHDLLEDSGYKDTNLGDEEIYSMLKDFLKSNECAVLYGNWNRRDYTDRIVKECYEVHQV